mgnify:CR=1 FL=1
MLKGLILESLVREENNKNLQSIPLEIKKNGVAVPGKFVVSIKDEFSVADFVKSAEKCIEKIRNATCKKSIKDYII